MEQFSLALQMAWQLGAEEAVNLGSEYIEPEHMLVGICSIEKLFSAESSDARLSEFSLAGIRAEWQELMPVFVQARISASSLRHACRRGIAAGTVTPGISRKVSRSARTRAAFRRAEDLARQAGSSLVGLGYLMAALAEDPAVLRTVEAEQGDIGSLWKALQHNAKNCLQPVAPLKGLKSKTSGVIEPSRSNDSDGKKAVGQ